MALTVNDSAPIDHRWEERYKEQRGKLGAINAAKPGHVYLSPGFQAEVDRFERAKSYCICPVGMVGDVYDRMRFHCLCRPVRPVVSSRSLAYRVGFKLSHWWWHA